MGLFNPALVCMILSNHIMWYVTSVFYVVCYTTMLKQLGDHAKSIKAKKRFLKDTKV
jgi:hypothetical protein